MSKKKSPRFGNSTRNMSMPDLLWNIVERRMLEDNLSGASKAMQAIVRESESGTNEVNESERNES